MKIRTNIWNSPDLPSKLEKISYTYGIFAIANIITAIAYNSKTLLIINTLPALLTILITLSHNKWKKEASK